MSAKGTTMRKITQIIRLHFEAKLGMAQKPPVLVNIMHAAFYPNVLPFRHECYDSIAL